MGTITRLPCETYRLDIPGSLRAMADQLEKGEMDMPESMVIVTSGDTGVKVYSQGIKADDEILTVGLLEFGKGLIINAHSPKNG